MTIDEAKGNLIHAIRWNDMPKKEALEIAIQALEQEPKTGHWILTSDDDYEYCTCSECGYQNGENWMIGSQIKFCQECGVKMVEPQESEE